MKLYEDFMDGYAWPQEWNKNAEENGWEHAVLPEPPRRKRAWRALLWSSYGVRARLALWISPDGTL